MNKILEINDLKKLAKKKLPKMFYDYIDTGSYSGITYERNEEDFKKIKLKQRVGVNIKNRDLSTYILGKKYNFPLGLAPVGMGGMMYPNGEILAAKAARNMNIPYILSTMSICSIEQVAEYSKNTFWFQLYVMKDKEFVENVINRARKAKCDALVVTMDLPLLAQRHNDIRNGLSAPPKLGINQIFQLISRPEWCLKMMFSKNKTFGNILGHAKGVKDISSIVSWSNEQFDQELTWDYVKWIKKLWGGPIILKGILDVDDAMKAVEIGAEAIIVSNHGGRQLDGAISSILALNNISKKVGAKLEIYVDGGFRNGADIIKAKALGAKAVFVGRPYLYGLSAKGFDGVKAMIDIFKKEADVTLALCGETNINKLSMKNVLQ
ncbi:MAG: alpha-hydroxy-acid oxidizing protein [Alphaproteobacteria bacterium TMED93]|nr:MAG: alpha-hydroxy-acid oxidizing protein [Alphaproteobacteria bacterium TMED93]